MFQTIFFFLFFLGSKNTGDVPLASTRRPSLAVSDELKLPGSMSYPSLTNGMSLSASTQFDPLPLPTVLNSRVNSPLPTTQTLAQSQQQTQAQNQQIQTQNQQTQTQTQQNQQTRIQQQLQGSLGDGISRSPSLPFQLADQDEEKSKERSKKPKINET